MIAPVDGRQWVKRQEQEPVLEPEQWMTRIAEIEAAALAKRQIGIEFTLGGAVLSIGLDSNGLPAFTITEAPPSIPTVAPAPVVDTTADTPLDTNTPAPSQDTTVPEQTTAAAVPTATINSPLNTTPVNTASGNTVLPTSPLITLGTSLGSLGSSGLLIPSTADLSIPSIQTGQVTTTEVIFAGGTSMTSVMTLGSAATEQPTKQLSPPAIAGAVVGAVGGTAALLLLLVLCVRWRRHVRDNKRISRGGESIKALHTGPAPMMAHNSARYTNLFPQRGSGAVNEDAASSNMAFLPAGATGFLNRAPGSPLRPDSPASHIHNDAVPIPASQGVSGRFAPTLLAPPSPTMTAPERAGEVAFLAANASTWLNRNSASPLGHPAPPAPPAMYDPRPLSAAALGSQNASTRSLPSQFGAAPHNGEVTFLPADASGFLNRNSTAPALPSGPTSAPGSYPTATMATSSTRSLPSQVGHGPENSQVVFLPADASGFLNRNSSVQIQPSGPTNNNDSLAPAAATANSHSDSTGSLSSRAAPTSENGQVQFLPAGASGFLNRNSNSPFQAGPPYEQTPSANANEPSFQKIYGYKVPSQFDTGAYAGPASANFASASTGPGIPTPAHVTEQGSAGTTSNYLTNNNPEWFGANAQDSRYMPPATVAEAAPTHFSGSPVDPNTVNNEVDEFLASQPVLPHSALDRPQQSFSPPQFGSPAYTSQNPSPETNISQQEFGQPAYQSGPSHLPDVREAPPSMPGGYQEYNSPWGSAVPQWPGPQSYNTGWVPPNSSEAMPSGSGNQAMSWPRPPDVDWDRPRVRPRDAL